MIEDSGGGEGVLDIDKIKFGVESPQMEVFGQELYPTLAEKAAILGFTIILAHAFVDGNKRVGHAAMAHFLFLNDHIIDADDDEQERFILSAAAGEMSKETFTEWVKIHIRPFDFSKK